MNDLELTKACAEAMGYSTVLKKGDHVHVMPLGPTIDGIYWPLDDDAQAMALVKHCLLDLTMVEKVDGRDAGWWRVDAPQPHNITSRHVDLNRAIVRCVAEMQSTK